MITSGWSLQDNGTHIEKTFVFKDFSECFAFMTRVAMLCEVMNHHVEWHNVYNKVHIVLTTHDIGGLSQKDFEMSEKINLLLFK